MMDEDARFEDGGERPVNLGAMDTEDLKVISALVQDAILPITEMRFERGARRFALLLNRFRWEDRGLGRHAPERVQAVLAFENVMSVQTQGFDRSDKDVILAVLTVEWIAGEDAAGHVVITLAGDGAIRLDCEALEATLKDVTRPYAAPSKKVPDHGA